MRDGDILILKEHEVNSLLAGREQSILERVRWAYETHAEGDSGLPHSTFLRFPDNGRNRIIALPAYLGGGNRIAGIKWISSFPGNLERGLNRASAVVILNSPDTGRPEAILEGSIISAKRTAASAALAAHYLHSSGAASSVAVIGCGVINFEILRFLLAIRPEIRKLIVFDLASERAQQFKDRCDATFRELTVETTANLNEALKGASLISIATTALQPHIHDLSSCPRGTTILHISLRDLSPQLILSADNVVDDIDHVCRAQTSVHLAEQEVGHRRFIRTTLAEILLGRSSARNDGEGVTVFSPFGLGILDLAVAQLVSQLARAEGQGTIIDSFLASPFADRQENGAAS